MRQLGTVVTDGEQLEDVLAQIATFAKTAIPAADGVGVTLVQHNDAQRPLLAWSVTDPFVREMDRLQYDTIGEGPCVTAMLTRRPLVSGSLGADTRWPRFGGRAARHGVHSALALPLLVRDSVVGAINVYAHDRDAFGERAVRLGEQFCGPAAISVHNTRMLHAARVRAQQLQAALTSRAVIDQAIGVIRSRSGGTSDDALLRLKAISQAENVKVSVVAERLVAEAVRRVQVRHGGE